MDLELALTHWPFFVAASAFHILGVVLKNGPLSRKRAREVRWVRFVRRWFPVPLIVVTSGIAVGAYAPVPVPGDVQPQFAWLYYLGAAVLPIVWHNVHREWKRYKGEELPPDDEDGVLEDARSTSVPPVPPN